VEKILAQYGSNPIFEYIEPDYIVTKGTISPQATFPMTPVLINFGDCITPDKVAVLPMPILMPRKPGIFKKAILI